MDNIVLQFDKMSAEQNELAHDHFKQHNKKFYPDKDNGKDTYKYVYDSCINAIYFKDEYLRPSENSESMDVATTTQIGSKYKLLADKIEEKAELFSQLESEIGKLPKQDVKNYDIKLLVQILRYSKLSNSPLEVYKVINMNENTPLFKLGLITMASSVEINACPNTAVVCKLFSSLCNEVGLFHTVLNFRNNQSEIDAESITGCFGVITEQSDVDSAVDAFLSSTTWYPWKLQRLYIQESVFESVKKIFEWKCNTDRDATVFVYDGKKFIFDYVAEETEGIRVEAYRTTKELISIISEYDPPFLSLWCNNNAESNEICFAKNVNAPVVWVNDYANFDGPLEASQAVYSIFLINEENKFITTLDDVYTEKLNKLRETWLKKDLTKRVDLLIKVLRNYKHNYRKYMVEYLESTIKENRNFVHIVSGNIVIGVRNNLISLAEGSLSNEIIDFLYEGTMVIFKRVKENQVGCEIAEKLAEIGVPIVFWDEKATAKKKVKVAKNTTLYELRVIRQSYGTIFAN